MTEQEHYELWKTFPARFCTACGTQQSYDQYNYGHDCNCGDGYWCEVYVGKTATSAHAEYIYWHGLPAVYQYDSAEDGPECEVITRILASHPIRRVLDWSPQ